MPNKPQFLAQNASDCMYLSDHPESKVGTYVECARFNHEFFLSRGFQMLNGRPFDGGNSGVRYKNGVPVGPVSENDSGFEVFSGVTLHTEGVDTFVAEFTHCDGDGPVARIRAL